METQAKNIPTYAKLESDIQEGRIDLEVGDTLMVSKVRLLRSPEEKVVTLIKKELVHDKTFPDTKAVRYTFDDGKGIDIRL